MGGRMFPGAGQLDRPTLLSIIERDRDEVFMPLGVTEFSLVGGAARVEAGTRVVTSDVDVAIATPHDRTTLTSMLKGMLPEGCVRRSGEYIHIRRQHPMDPAFHYQVDIIRSENPTWTAWLMNGFFRHMMFAYLAKMMSQPSSRRRVTVIAPGGIRVTIADDDVAGTDVVPRTERPSTVLATLALGMLPYDAFELKKLVGYLQSLGLFATLAGYLEYVKEFRGRPDYIEVTRAFADVEHPLCVP